MSLNFTDIIYLGKAVPGSGGGGGGGAVSSVNGQTGDVVITGNDVLPDQTGHSGEFLTTDGTDASWAVVNALPTQTGQSGKFLTTDGTDASWSDITKVNTTITLTAAGWSSNTQTVSVTGVTADGVVMVSPDPTDQSAYTSAGILCTAQAANSLTFSCDTVPSGDLSVNIVML